MRIITIPAPLVEQARAGILHELGLAAEQIAGEVAGRNPELEAPLRLFDAMRALHEQMPVQTGTAAQLSIDHGPALVQALKNHVRYEVETVAHELLAALSSFVDALPDFDERAVTA